MSSYFSALRVSVSRSWVLSLVSCPHILGLSTLISPRLDHSQPRLSGWDQPDVLGNCISVICGFPRRVSPVRTGPTHSTMTVHDHTQPYQTPPSLSASVSPCSRGISTGQASSYEEVSPDQTPTTCLFLLSLPLYTPQVSSILIPLRGMFAASARSRLSTLSRPRLPPTQLLARSVRRPPPTGC